MPVLGEVVEGHMHLSALGGIVEQVWLSLPSIIRMCNWTCIVSCRIISTVF